MTDSLTVDGETHLITENRDEFGRSAGFAYSKNGVAACAEKYGYAADGRLSSAAFNHGGEWKTFGYNYLPGTHLLQSLSMPNGMTFTQQYEPQRDLLTGMEYNRGETAVVQRYYTYDALRRPLTRQQNRQGGTRSDSFTHNNRSELTAATLGTTEYAYAYDNIGNRKSAQEDAETATAYTANNLNQYTAEGSFTPAYDADGNQTLVQTSTGIWSVIYNAENRPTQFTRSNADGTTTRITCAYDFMGRRATKKVETIAADAGATTSLHQRYLYRGYLQIACCDLTRENHPHLWFINWDPTHPVATRPLALRKDATWYTYGWDLTKNICEVFGADGLIKTTYSYTPYGAVSAEGTANQFIQWSSEFHDEELGLVYYNYRHYNPAVGRWLGRDIIPEETGKAVYLAFGNNPANNWDVLGMIEDKQFHFEESSCTLTLNVKIKIKYNDEKKYNAVWSESSRAKFWADLKGNIESLFNSSQYKLIPTQTQQSPSSSIFAQNQSFCKKCPCPKGVELRLELHQVASGENDWSLKAYAGTSRQGDKFRPASSGVGFPTSGVLYSDSNLPTGNKQQVPSAHEFGHALGLNHPGRGLWFEKGKIYIFGNTPEAYSHAGIDVNGNTVNGAVDLMGQGMGLRPFYFALWQENMNGRYQNCTYDMK